LQSVGFVQVLQSDLSYDTYSVPTLFFIGWT